MKHDLGFTFFVACTCMFVFFFCASLRMDRIEKIAKNKVSFSNETDIPLDVKNVRVVKGLSFDIPIKDGMASGCCKEDVLSKEFFFKTSQEDVYVYIKVLKQDYFAPNLLESQYAVLDAVGSYDYGNMDYQQMPFPNIYEGNVENMFLSDAETLVLLDGNAFSFFNDDNKISLSSCTNYIKSEILEHYGVVAIWNAKEKKLLLLAKVTIL